MSHQSSDWRELVFQTVQPNRRKDARYEAHGPIAIFLEPAWGAVPATVHGELLDKSDGGCRVQHNFGPLALGRKVWLSWADEYRPACVVWSYVVEERAETGFRFGD